MICRPNNQPDVGQDIDAMVCWMTSTATAQRRKLLRDQAHDPRRRGAGEGPAATASTSTRCTATSTPTRSALNEIGRVALRTTEPLFFDDYRRNRATGSFILIDEATQQHVAAGMIRRRDAVQPVS